LGHIKKVCPFLYQNGLLSDVLYATDEPRNYKVNSQGETEFVFYRFRLEWNIKFSRYIADGLSLPLFPDSMIFFPFGGINLSPQIAATYEYRNDNPLAVC